MNKLFKMIVVSSIPWMISAQDNSNKKKDHEVYSYEIKGDVLMHHFDIFNSKIKEKNWHANRFNFADKAKVAITSGDDKGDYQILQLLKFYGTYEVDDLDVNKTKREGLKTKEKEKSAKKIESYKTEMQKFLSAISFPEEGDENAANNYVMLKEKIKSDYKKKVTEEEKRIKKFNDSVDQVLRKTPKEMTITARKKNGKIIGNPRKINYQKKYINIDDQDKLFAIKTSDFNSLIENGYIRKRYRQNYHLSYGASFTIPFKIRPEVGDENIRITPELTLGGFIGGKYRINKYKDHFLFLPVLTAGVTTININQDTVSSEDEDGLVLARTLSLGAILELDKFQVGVVAGWDRPGGEIAKDWIYKDRLWYSLSIGFDFFNRSADDKSKSDNN